MPDNDAINFVRGIKVGWNLGNTFDAIDVSGITKENELNYEKSWCSEFTTIDNLAAVKAAGFETIRIPVSWHNHLTDEENYTISEAWLARVKEVVDYCIDEGLYVILNIHHDDGKDYLYPTKAKQDQSVKYITAIWTQLADRFMDYDEHLIFESMNEPRLVGSVFEWALIPIIPSCVEAVRQINVLNQAFVNAVRATGGNNETRYLLCPGYDASADGATDLSYRIPDDPVCNDRRIIVAVHAYTPDSFAHSLIGTSRWSSKSIIDRLQVTVFMDKLYYKYILKGIPVLLDEFGALDKNGNTASRVDYAGFYVASARARGMSCLWWNNNIMSGDGERFGLLDRETLEWVYPEIVQAMMDNA